MARAVDADVMLAELKPIDYEAEHSAVLISDVAKIMREWVERQPTLTPPNEALTLEELREMDGEPVWVTPTGFWALVISKRGQRVQLMCSDGETVWADKEIELVGPVYRRLPEGEENAQ